MLSHKHVRCCAMAWDMSCHESMAFMGRVEVERKSMTVEGMQLKIPPEKVSSLLVSRVNHQRLVQGL